MAALCPSKGASKDEEYYKEKIAETMKGLLLWVDPTDFGYSFTKASFVDDFGLERVWLALNNFLMFRRLAGDSRRYGDCGGRSHR